MALPTAPLNLSADGTNINTAKLTWDAPVPVADPEIIGYEIERSLGRSVFTIVVDDGGSGYASVPTVTIASPASGTTATATAILDTDVVDTITVDEMGSGYITAPTVTIDPPASGTTATATATINTSFTTIVANTNSTDTFFTDTPITPVRINAIYRVSAINSEGIGSASDTASTTLATSEAQTIQELLFDNWSLTGELAKETTDTMTESVHFFERGQVPGNKFPKAITVQKINALGNENIIEHPKFFEQSETFEITCFLQVIDAADDQFSVWIDLMQQMTSEVSRILKTVFAPSTVTGEFFSTNTGWTKDDTFLPDDPELTRTLRFTLSRIVSSSPEVFIGYGGILLFDFSRSSGDSLPTADYLYSQVERVQILQGWRNIPYVTTDSPTTTAIPNFFRGSFSGRFLCNMQLKKSDITPTTLNSLSQIFLPQSNGELGTASFFHITPNTETPSSSLTELVSVNITNVEKITENERLVEFRISGNLTGPTSFFITGDMLYGNETGTSGNMQYEDTDNMGYG
jgi:hypothetical protein